MKTVALIFAATLIIISVDAQIPITSSSLAYTQDFNTLDAAGASQTRMPPEWGFYEWGGASAGTTYRAGTGSSATGDTYSFGATGSAERALGSLCSAGVPNVSYGVRFVNNSSAYINAVTITFKAEQWRRGGTGNTDSVRFYYSTASGKTIADTSLSLWNEVPALLMTSITTAAPASSINGNDTAKVIAAIVPIPLPAGDTIALRWYDYNSGGSDDGLSIDSLTVVFNIGPPSLSDKPKIVSLSPAPNTTNVPAAVNLSITFDRNIKKGTAGNIYVKDLTAQTTQTLAASSSNVVVSGKVATITGIGLQIARPYHVTFDSSAFSAAGFLTTGIYDTAAWSFTTAGVGIGSIAQPAALPVTVMNPASDGMFRISCTLPHAAVLTATVYDLTGREAARYIYQAAKGNNRFSLHTALPAGTYIIRIDNGKQWGSVKAVMQ